MDSDERTGEELRDEGMARAEQSTSEEYKEAAWAAIELLAESGREFTSEDVYELVGGLPESCTGLGPLLRRALCAGLIVYVRHDRAKRPSRQCGDVKVYVGTRTLATV